MVTPTNSFTELQCNFKFTDQNTYDCVCVQYGLLPDCMSPFLFNACNNRYFIRGTRKYCLKWFLTLSPLFLSSFLSRIPLRAKSSQVSRFGHIQCPLPGKPHTRTFRHRLHYFNDVYMDNAHEKS